jgi:RNA polymerase sigma-70 factor, ECF subfamily
MTGLISTLSAALRIFRRVRRMTDSVEQSLVAGIRAGDTDALAKFVQLKRETLLGYIGRQLGTGLRKKVEPEDILQEVSIEAIKGIDHAFDDPFGWLCRMCEQKIVDAYRRFYGAEKRNAAREVSADGPVNSDQDGIAQLLVASLTSPSAAFSREYKHLRMLQALEVLPDEQREAVKLRYLEGLGSREIAERLGMTNGAVRVMLSRSLGKLQAELGPDAAPR